MRLALPLAIGVLTAIVLTACSGSPVHSRAPSPSTSGQSGNSVTTATRWWSNSATTAGSTIDPQHPDAAASQLHSSRQAYCAMLQQTVQAGRSILPGVTSGDPALVTASKAFVGELQKVAPSEVSAAWQILGKTILSLVESGGAAPKLSNSAAQISSAGHVVSVDAKGRCGLNLSVPVK